MAGIGSLLGKEPILIEVEGECSEDSRREGGGGSHEEARRLRGPRSEYRRVGIGTNHAAQITGNILEDGR